MNPTHLLQIARTKGVNNRVFVGASGLQTGTSVYSHVEKM